MESRELTFGEKAVGLTFNPSGDTTVNVIKQIFSEAIDAINNLRNDSDNGEVKRMCSIAITDAQVAQMWAVKAATWRD